MKENSILLQRLLNLTLQKKQKRGLENALIIQKAASFPDLLFKSIHVGGTNGKGSVCLKIAKALEFSGYKVGLYTSPHLSSLRERILIQEKPISAEDFAKHLAEVFNLMDELSLPLTFFEVTTFLAFLYFASQKVDFAVVEVGLGGRLDTTNFLQPILSVITSIGMDHMSILGNSLDQIAWEKAGIIKKGISVVIGDKARFFPILNTAKEQASQIFFASCSSHPFYDYENLETAKTALQYLMKKGFCAKKSIEEALFLRPSCRFEIVPKDILVRKRAAFPQEVILDVAHNPAAFKKLQMALTHYFPNRKFRFLLAFSGDKDIEGSIDEILNIATHIHLVRNRHTRLADPAKVKDILIKKRFFSVSASHDFNHEIENALDAAVQKQEVLVISGSFFIMKDARQNLGFQDLADEEEFSEKYIFL